MNRYSKKKLSNLAVGHASTRSVRTIFVVSLVALFMVIIVASPPLAADGKISYITSYYVEEGPEKWFPVWP